MFAVPLIPEWWSPYFQNQWGGPFDGSFRLHDRFSLLLDLTHYFLPFLLMVNVEILINVVTLDGN